MTDTAAGIEQVMDDLKALLLEKNKAYGDSALDPVRIFSQGGPTEQLLVRIDDKLSRVARGKEYPGDDTVKDLIGYLVLLLVSRREVPLADWEVALLSGETHTEAVSVDPQPPSGYPCCRHCAHLFAMPSKPHLNRCPHCP